MSNGGQIGYFAATIPTSGSYMVAGTYPNNIGTGPNPYYAIGASGGYVEVSYSYDSIALSSLPTSLTVATTNITALAGAATRFACVSSVLATGSFGGLVSLSSTIYCPSDGTKVIGLHYSGVGGDIYWGVGTGILAFDGKYILRNPFGVWTSDTLTGTYTCPNPYLAPNTTTVS